MSLKDMIARHNTIKGFAYAKRRMREEGIYDLPLEESPENSFRNSFGEYERGNPKPKFFSGGK